MSLDAIVPGLPHSADNIQWVCMRVNLGKQAFTDKDFRVWAKAAFCWSGLPITHVFIPHPRVPSHSSRAQTPCRAQINQHCGLFYDSGSPIACEGNSDTDINGGTAASKIASKFGIIFL
jgi:hypothetical protein